MARPGLSIASPGVLESSLASWYLRAGKEARAGVGLAGGTRLHAFPFKRVDIQAEAQSTSQGHQGAWWGQERRGSWAQGHCQELPFPFGPSHKGPRASCKGRLAGLGWAGRLRQDAGPVLHSAGKLWWCFSRSWRRQPLPKNYSMGPSQASFRLGTEFIWAHETGA